MEKAGFDIYINEKSGTVLELGRDRLQSLIHEHGLPVHALYFLSPDKMSEVLAKDLAKNKGDYPVLIGGGDGTIKSAAKLAMDYDVPLGVLPLGTMNLLANDVGIPTDLEQAIKAYAQMRIKTLDMDVGHVKGEKDAEDIFLCCIGLGTMPEASEYREQHRDDPQLMLIPRMTVYVLKQMDRLKRRRLRLYLDRQKKDIKTSALVISNNQYEPQSDWQDNNFKRLSLQDSVLGVYSVAPYNLWDKIRLLFNLRVGNWKNDATLKEWHCKTLKIGCKQKSVLLSLDGETEKFATPLTVSIQSRALPVLVPERKTNVINGEKTIGQQQATMKQPQADEVAA